ncbi:MAG TPA: hypothetical protein VGB74_13235, partial [Actinoplanes sp.]
AGRVPVKYRSIPGAAPPGPISVRAKEGSSKDWLGLLIDNHAHQLASVKIAGRGGTLHSAVREEWNYWVLPRGAGSGPFKVEITDIYRRTVVVSRIKLAPRRTQETAARLSGPVPRVNPPRVNPPRAPRPTEKATRTLPTAPRSSFAAAPVPHSTTAAAVSGATVDLAADSGSSCG